VIDPERQHEPWNGVEELADFLAREPQRDVSRALLESNFGTLRRAKIAAWYLTDADWDQLGERGGSDKAGHEERFPAGRYRDRRKSLVASVSIGSGYEPQRYSTKFTVHPLVVLHLQRGVCVDIDRGLNAWSPMRSLRRPISPSSRLSSHDLLTPTLRFCRPPMGAFDNTGNALIDDECTDIASDVSGLFRADPVRR
jgi:hypothetical protein